MDEFIISKINDSLLNIKLGVSDGIIHLENALDVDLVQESFDKVKDLNFEVSKFEDKIARYEIALEDSSNKIIEQLSTILNFIRNSFHLNINYFFESFAFKYFEGHFVPEHVDMDRHKLIALTYFGEFTGGDFVYFSKILKKEIKITPGMGDIIIAINEGSEFDNLKLKHKVDLIQSGIRYTMATSLVSNR